ncbi:MAG: Urea transporter [Gemmatimonadaceae bacterium]|nr:Urea transporter [Gemmatimonadaceae bacterium]
MTKRYRGNPLASLLRGFGQIMLQQNAVAGALFLAGIGVASRPMAVAGIVGVVAGMTTAWILRFEASDISRGMYGFNGALVGIGMVAFFEPGVVIFLLIVLGGALSSILMHAMLRRADVLPAYTAPFVLTTWATLAIAHTAQLPGAVVEVAPNGHGDLFIMLRGIGQVMFQDSWIAGAIFVLGLLLSSRHSAAWALIGSTAGLVASRGLGFPDPLATAGLFGFNGALTGIALGDKYRADAMAPLLGILLSTVLIRAFQVLGIPALTAPFVLSTWIVILMHRAVHRESSLPRTQLRGDAT